MRSSMREWTRATLAAGLLLASAAVAAQAASAERGRAVYSTLPGNPGPGSCVSCHGDPADNRNNVLAGAGRPEHVVKTMNTVSAMGFLRSYLRDEDVRDVAAYLATILAAGTLDASLAPEPSIDLFGAQRVGTASPERTIVFAAPAAAAVDIAAVVSTSGDFVIARTSCVGRLAPASACEVGVVFRPVAAGDAIGLVTALGREGLPLRSATVSGEGTATEPPRLAWHVSAPAELAFGDVPVGASGVRRASIVNTGARPVTIERVRSNGTSAARFAVEGSCRAGTVLAPGADCEVVVRFAPAASGVARGWLETVGTGAANARLMRLAATATDGSAAAEAPARADADQEAGGGGFSVAATLVLLAAVLALRRRAPESAMP